MTIVQMVKRFFLPVLVMIPVALNFQACNQRSPFDASEEDSVAALEKVGSPSHHRSSSRHVIEYDYTGRDAKVYGNSYPQSNSLTLDYSQSRRQYQGGSMNLPNGSRFTISRGALTPPQGMNRGESVEITMTCEKDDVNNELVFTYGPHGSQFSPPAELKLSWKDLETDVPKLYYIDEQDHYVEQVPDDIDVRGKWLTISVHHFSRYAVAWSR